MMINSSNYTTPPSDTTGFLVFSIVMVLTAGGAIFFNILTAVVASTRKELYTPIRILMVNLLVGSTLTAVALVLQSTVSIPLLSREFNGTTDDVKTDGVCRVYVLFFRSSAVVRLCNVAAYSIGVFTVVIKGRSRLKSVHTIPLILIAWLYALGVSFYLVIPKASELAYIGPGYAWCTTKPRIYLLATWYILGGIPPMAVCTTVMVATWCYLRKHKLSEVPLFRKGLMRLTLFLFLANTVNLINTFPTIIIKANPDEYIVPYIVSTLGAVFLWSSAVVIVFFIAPIRHKMAAILCCFCKQRQPGKSLGDTARTPLNKTRLLM